MTIPPSINTCSCPFLSKSPKRESHNQFDSMLCFATESANVLPSGTKDYYWCCSIIMKHLQFIPDFFSWRMKIMFNLVPGRNNSESFSIDSKGMNARRFSVLKVNEDRILEVSTERSKRGLLH